MAHRIKRPSDSEVLTVFAVWCMALLWALTRASPALPLPVLDTEPASHQAAAVEAQLSAAVPAPATSGNPAESSPPRAEDPASEPAEEDATRPGDGNTATSFSSPERARGAVVAEVPAAGPVSSLYAFRADSTEPRLTRGATVASRSHTPDLYGVQLPSALPPHGTNQNGRSECR